MESIHANPIKEMAFAFRAAGVDNNAFEFVGIFHLILHVIIWMDARGRPLLLNFPLDRFFQYTARLFLLIRWIIKNALPDTVYNSGVVHFSVWLMVIFCALGR